MSTVRTKRQRLGTNRLVLDGVSWKTYERLLRLFARRPSVRLTYDRGTLELMTISHRHDSYGRFPGRIVVTLTEEFNFTIKAGGSTTYRRKLKRRGLEPDDSFWIASEPLMRGKLELDLDVDPPPDLAIEIDVTRSSLDRLGIYAALRVPEVWRFDGTTMTVFVLDENGCYREAPTSRVFQALNPAALLPFIAMRATMDENAVVRELRNWIRQRIADGWK